MSTVRSACSTRWLVFAVLFLHINAIGWVCLVSRSGRADRERTVEFTAGRAGTVAGRDELRWRFSRPMVTAQEIGLWAATGPAAIEPAAPGRFCWIDECELRFQPAERWRPCTAFAARLDGRVGSGAGVRLGAPREFRFQTEPLRVVDVKQANFDAERRSTLRIEFNAPPVRSRLMDYVGVLGGAGTRLDWALLGEVESAVVLIQTAPVLADAVTVVVRKGLTSTGGPLGIPADGQWAVRVSDALCLQKLQPVSYAFEPGEILAEFNAPLDLDRLSASVEIRPPVEFAVTRLSSWQSSGCRIAGEFQPGKSYEVTFRKGLRADNGATLAEDANRTAYFPDRPAGLTVPVRGNYLSPHGSLIVPVRTVNLRKFALTSERIYPNNLVFFAMRESERYEESCGAWCEDSQVGISHVSASRDYAVPLRPNAAVETQVRMPDLMGGSGAGAFLLSASAEGCAQTRHLVVVTDIGLTVKRSGRDVLVWANSIHDLTAVSGAEVRVYSPANQELLAGETDADGLARLEGALDGPDSQPFLVTARRGDDISYLALAGTEADPPGDLGGAPYLSQGYEAYVFSDRGIYRPGELSHVRAVVRDRLLQPPGKFPLALRVLDPAGREFSRLTASLREFGAADFAIPWPAYARTGRYTLEARLPGADSLLGVQSVSVEEFVPPQVKLSVSPGPGRGRDALTFDVQADYLFGRPAAALPAEASIQVQPVAFTPPDWPLFTFGDEERQFPVVNTKIGTGRLDDNGAARFTFSVPPGWRPPAALRVLVCATVTESGGRAVSACASQPVDVYPYYAGIRRAAGGDVVRLGTPLRFAVAAVDPEGKPAAGVGSLRARLSRVTWSTLLKRKEDGSYAYESERRLTEVEDRAVALRDGAAEFQVEPKSSGAYLLSAAGPDGGAPASLTFHVGAPDDTWMSWSLDQPGHVDLDLDAPEYRAGETAVLLIKSPFAGKALVTVESDRVLSRRVIELTGNTAEVELPVLADYAPNVYCAVSVIRPVRVDASLAPHRAIGAIPLKVAAPRHGLGVAIAAPPELRPGARFKAAIAVTGADGGPASAEVTLAAVDEGICMLTAFETPDPLAFFRRKRALGVSAFDVYSLLMPEQEAEAAAGASHPGGDAGPGLMGRLNPVDARRFKPVALWAPPLRTDASGKAEIELDVPEFTGQLRLMAVAVGRESFGSAAAAVPVRRPLVVLSSLPRFLAPGDRCEVPIRIFNETGSNAEARVSLACEGPVAATPPAATVALAAGERGGLWAALTAAQQPGTARVRLCVEGGGERYEETFELPVRPASPRVTAGDFGAVRPGEVAELRLPADWFRDTARHTVWCSGLPTLKLAGGLESLLRYPYGCVEQTTSSAFPLLYLADVAAAARPGSLGPSETAGFVGAGILRLLSMQRADGSFSGWPNGTSTYRWGSVYATHFLVEAGRAGYDVPAEALQKAKAYLDKVLAEPLAPPADRDSRVRAEDLGTRAYICRVLAAAGAPPRGWIARLAELESELDPGARVHAAAALAAAGRRAEARAMVGRLGLAAAEAAPRETDGALNSGTRNVALLLAAWMDIDPADPMVPRLAQRLESLRLGGGWYTTQETALSLLALGKYARYAQGERKPFEGELSWEGPGGPRSAPVSNDAPFRLLLTDADFARQDTRWPATPGRGQDAGQAPSSHLPPPGGRGPPNDVHLLRLANRGPGTAYFAWRSEGVAAGGSVPEADRQIAARRELLRLDGSPLGTNVLAQGELAVVRIRIVPANGTVNNLVVEDLLPAGLEAENARLKTSQVVPWVKDRCLAEQNVEIRDDRVILFVGTVIGEASFYYAARAVTPGDFVYPALAAECMYDPSVGSVHGQARLRVTREGGATP